MSDRPDGAPSPGHAEGCHTVLRWVPLETADHATVLTRLISTHQADGRLIHDAHLAALAMCHGAEVCSADADFARFSEVRWRNPLAA